MEDALQQTLDTGMFRLEDETRRNVDTYNINASGELRRNIDYERFGGQRQPFFYTTAVRVKTDYAKYVDLGTGYRGVSYNGRSYPAPSSRPPIENILSWIIEKGITPIEFDTRYELAVAIAKSIEVSGTSPKPFFRDAIHRTEPYIKDEMEEAGSIAGRRTHRRI
jgi:hypothetical protein